MNAKNTRRAFLSSIVALVLCFTMLMGTTFAWFTDTAKVNVNTIQSGTLDIDLEKKVNGEWVDAEGTTLNFVKSASAPANEKLLWEPGCTYQLEEVRIANNGNLALKYKVVISGVQGPAGSNLADVLEVMVGGQYLLDSEGNRVTLAEVMLDPDGVAYGSMLPKTYVEIGAISLHMQEDAGNEYQNKTIDNIAITVMATQDTVEYDSTTNQYDANAGFLATDYPIALVSAIDELVVTTVDNTTETLDAGYSFKTTETEEEAVASAYAKWHADFVVSVDQPVAAGQLTLAGQYDDWNPNWVVFQNPDALEANEEVRLLEYAGAVMNYEELCTLVKEFKCGVAGIDALDGATVTVELKLYETEAPSADNNNSVNVETGNSLTIGTYTYTFTSEPVAAPEVPVANVTALNELIVNASLEGAAAAPLTLDTGYTFTAVDTAEEAAASPYAAWHADFVVTSSTAVEQGDLTLAGQYAAWSTDWVAFNNPNALAAGESVRLLEFAGGVINYAELCNYVKEFKCGANDNGNLPGTTLTVELRLYEATGANITDETGNYIVIGKYSYTF